MNVCKHRTNKMSGFTLIEVLITIVILALLVSFAIPAYKNFIDQKRLRLATEDLYNFIKAGQSRGLNLPSSYYMSLTTGANWCYGLSDTATCDCTSDTSCTISGVATFARSTNYSGSALTLSTTGFSGTALNPYITFEGRRGTLTSTGTLTLTTSTGLATTISANQQGLVTICSNNVTSYSPCP